MTSDLQQFSDSELSGYLSGLIRSAPDAERMTITPQMAEIMLRRNESDEWHNRPQSRSSVRRLARAIREGRWVYTGETIIFSASGRLLNGQHRLTACLEADKPIEALVAFGVSDIAFKFMDVGTRRQAQHIFAIEDIPNSAFAAAACRIVKSYIDNPEWLGHLGGVNAAENDELLAFYYEHAGIQDSYHSARKIGDKRLMPPSWAGALHYLCAQKDRALADEFFYQVATGIGIQSEKSPAYIVRDRLVKNASERRSNKVPNEYLGAYVVIGWNAQRQGRKLSIVKWAPNNNGRRIFPRIK